VGRGSEPSLCILVSEVGGDAGERLEVFRDTTDGFQIAQADLRIRGQGDLFGSRQHGKDPFLRFADLARDEDLLTQARDLARGLVSRDPELAAPENQRVRALLEGRHSERLKMWRVG
jgi:ATP-dependent DNA helicase RecG